MEAEFSQEEQELMGRLRAKYASESAAAKEAAAGGVGLATDELANVSGGGAGAGAPAGMEYALRAGGNMSARACPQCQGLGRTIEVYNHRRMDRTCDACGGDGVTVYKDGKQVDAAAAQKQPPPATATAAAAANTPRWAQSSSEVVARLEADLPKLAGKIAQYEQELSGIDAALAAAASDEERALRADVAGKLRAHLGRLQTVRATMEEELQRHKSPSTVDELE